MTTEVISFIIQTLVKYGPAAARAVKDIFTVDKPTDEQWEKAFSLCEKSYEDYVRAKTNPPVA